RECPVPTLALSLLHVRVCPKFRTPRTPILVVNRLRAVTRRLTAADDHANVLTNLSPRELCLSRREPQCCPPCLVVLIPIRLLPRHRGRQRVKRLLQHRRRSLVNRHSYLDCLVLAEPGSDGVLALGCVNKSHGSPCDPFLARQRYADAFAATAVDDV